MTKNRKQQLVLGFQRKRLYKLLHAQGIGEERKWTVNVCGVGRKRQHPSSESLRPEISSIINLVHQLSETTKTD